MTKWIDLFSGLAGMSPDIIWAFGLVFVRVGGAMALLPAFGEQTVPLRARLVATVAFTAIVGPAVIDHLPDGDFGVLGPMLIEAGAGLALGFSLRLLILALQVAGALAAQAISLAQLTAAAGPEPVPALSQFLVLSALALGAALGLHLRAAELLILSYQVLPPGAVPDPSALTEWGLSGAGRAFALAFSLAAPFLIASVLYNLALGVINRAMPQLMVTLIGAPVLSIGGLALLAIALPVLLSVWADAYSAATLFPFQVPQ